MGIPSALPLPAGWPQRIGSALQHVLALARLTMTETRAWGVTIAVSERSRWRARVSLLEDELASLREEIRIKDARLARIPAKQRPHYPPELRLRILALRAARSWNAAQTARRFLLSPQTIAAWQQRIDDPSLVRPVVPVNRFPDFVALCVQTLKTSFPWLGTRRITELLARVSLHVSDSSVRRMLKRRPLKPPAAPFVSTPDENESNAKPVSSRAPNHTWNIDLSLLPTGTGGFWLPWPPLAALQCWPWCLWLAVVFDHYSRSVIGWHIWLTQPNAEQIARLLSRVQRDVGTAPKYLISDRGMQFVSDRLRRWAQRHGVKQRFGTLGKRGAIAVLERFFRTLKQEGWRPLLSAPLTLRAARQHVATYVQWYNELRPHRGLGGATPAEVYEGRSPACAGPRFETRRRYPVPDGVKLRAPKGTPLRFELKRFHGQRHLPVLRLQAAA